MSDRARGFRLLLLLPLSVLPSTLCPTGLHAQTCELDVLTQPTRVDATPSTRFVPSAGEAQIYVQRKYTDSLVARVFEVDQPGGGAWKIVSERPVLSIKPSPEKPDQGFTPTNSSAIRFIAPSVDNSFWQRRTFVARLCDQAAPRDALAIVRVPISPPNWAEVISVAFVAGFYVLLALTVSWIRGKHPLTDKYAAKYPALTRQTIYGWAGHLDPIVLTASAFNKGSIQKLQVLLFSFLISGMVLALVLRLGVLSDLSVTVALLLGVSAVGAAVAQKTSTNRDRLSFESWSWLVQKGILPISEEDPAGPRWSDLVMTNREFDVYKLQTLIFSVVVAVALLASGEERLASFTVPETLLGILGLSQIVYISGTLASPPSIKEVDGGIKSLIEMETKLQTVVARNVDTDTDGNLPTPLPLPPSSPPTIEARVKNAANAMKLYTKKADQLEIMLESTFGAELARNKLDPVLS